MTDLRTVRLRAGFSQEDLARVLGVPANTLRMWDSGLRPTPVHVVTRAMRLLDEHTRKHEALSLQTLAAEFKMHVRTLQAAARTGRLQTQFSTRSVFGRPMRFATRAAVVRFRDEHYRRFQGQRPCPAPLPTVPDDYDLQIRQLRLRLGLSLGQFAARIGAANKAVIYQWESRKREPSPVFWTAIEALQNAPHPVPTRAATRSGKSARLHPPAARTEVQPLAETSVSTFIDASPRCDALGHATKLSVADEPPQSRLFELEATTPI